MPNCVRKVVYYRAGGNLSGCFILSQEDELVFRGELDQARVKYEKLEMVTNSKWMKIFDRLEKTVNIVGDGELCLSDVLPYRDFLDVAQVLALEHNTFEVRFKTAIAAQLLYGKCINIKGCKVNCRRAYWP